MILDPFIVLFAVSSAVKQQRMFLNNDVPAAPLSAESPSGSKRKSFYQRVNDFLGLGSPQPEKQAMQSCEEGSADDGFVKPACSSGDLIAMWPTPDAEPLDHDLLTGEHFDDICDITMQEVPNSDATFQKPSVPDNNNIFDDTSIAYLVKCSDSSRKNTHIDSGKESLYIKFDPLYSKEKRDTIIAQALSVASSTEIDTGYETGSGASVNTDNFVVSTPKRCVSVDSFVVNDGKDKPTQRVRPVKLEVPETTASLTRSTPALVRSLSAIMTPSRVAIDKLISLSGSTPPNMSPRHSQHRSYNTHQMDHLQSLRLIIQKQDQDIMLLREENRELRCSLQNSDQNLTRTQEELNAKIKKLTEERDNLLSKEIMLQKQVTEKVLSNKQMCIVMEEYEKTISSLISDQQRDKIKSKELQEQLFAERDDAMNHLSNLETSFNDLLAKYEKSKSIIIEIKDREKSLQAKITEYEEAIAKYESLYTNLKEVTSQSLAKANQTLEDVQKNHSNEIAKFSATLKKNELTLSMLQESLTQKTKENEELTRICEQLIDSVH